MFTGCWITGHRLSARWFPFTVSGQGGEVSTDLLADVLAGPWSLAAMSLLVLGDAFFVVVPGEIAVVTPAAI